MRNKYHTVNAVSKSGGQIVERGNFDLTHKYMTADFPVLVQTSPHSVNTKNKRISI